MSLDDLFQEPPTLIDYRRQAAIPKEDRCECCQGLGLVIWQHSWSGPEYRRCPLCQGVGRKPEELGNERQSVK